MGDITCQSCNFVNLHCDQSGNFIAAECFYPETVQSVVEKGLKWVGPVFSINYSCYKYKQKDELKTISEKGTTIIEEITCKCAECNGILEGNCPGECYFVPFYSDKCETCPVKHLCDVIIHPELYK